MKRRNLIAASMTGLVAASLAMASVDSQASDDTVRLCMQRFYGTETDAIHNKFRAGERVPSDQLVNSVEKGN